MLLTSVATLLALPVPAIVEEPNQLAALCPLPAVAPAAARHAAASTGAVICRDHERGRGLPRGEDQAQ